MTGILVLDKNNQVVLIQAYGRKQIPVVSGQYLYLSVRQVWVPVLIRYSEQMQKWFFEGMPDLDIFHLKVMLKE